MRRLTVGRTIGVIIAVTGIAGAIYLGFESYRLNRAFHQWLDARPMEMAIDLSKPGEWTTSFHQTCQSAHSQWVYLRISPAPADTDHADELLTGLSGGITIRDTGGQEIVSAEMHPPDSHALNDGAAILIADIPRFAIGDYQATVTITSPAPALAERSQALYAKYHLCGLEKLPADIARILAIASGVVGVTAGVLLFASHRARRRM